MSIGLIGRTCVFLGRFRRLHFVGIGGIGMSGIAEVLLAHGFEVSGSDLRLGETSRRLQGLGARVCQGHHGRHLGQADVVVFSSAVASDNPELVEARARGLPVIRRAEMLAELMRLKHGVAIAGSHGKTTTTSLVATLLRVAGLDPTVIIGGKLNALGSNAARGAGELLVAEADESDGSFLHLAATFAVITNIDPEHLDFYGSLDALKSAFVDFANRVPFYGLVVACQDHLGVRDILPRLERRVATYGMDAGADYRAIRCRTRGLSCIFEIVRRGEHLGEFELSMPGEHNVLNALAAFAIVDELFVEHDTVRHGLSTFCGVQRRFTVLGAIDDVTIVDDYGHHPAEVRATLQAARSAYSGRIVVAFQPHRYTRTQALFQELTRCFGDADLLLLTEVYGAGEQPIAGASAERLAAAIREQGHRAVHYVPAREELAPGLAARVQPGDVVITLGAGDVTKTGPELLELLRRRVEHAATVTGLPILS
ncbi:MAG: UDP-N-acetylmuramate--L-alanine ligase [Proteobacteria bacterium]|nr:UDP-N-acetylmuramate--L-alanine ligase [Pseudomonadota bacterium]